MAKRKTFRGVTLPTLAVLATAAAAAGEPAAAGDRKPNRLIRESSPYLRQHADNPVDWYAWGPEAFAAARERDKPIFLSIGYSTCYWCHVMERESFEDEATAEAMNAGFVSIKVDREERPDVDAIYMAAVQAMTGRGGWPMSVFLDPHTLEPFAGGTYFPPEPRYDTPSFRQLMDTVTGEWTTDRQGVKARATDIADRVRGALAMASQPAVVGRVQVDRAVTSILAGYDPVHGGFRKGSPKFPLPVQLELLMAAAWNDPAARDAVVHTLDRMAMGGIFDQVGGGFHRYSTDATWLVPHFEKMLYDNAQLALVYTRAYRLTGDEFYAEVARETLDWVLREMPGPRAGYFSARDAEVDAREGASYVWTPGEILDALAVAGLDEHVEFALEVYGLKEGTNFQDPHHRDAPPANVLYLAERPEATAARLGMTVEAFNRQLSRVNRAMRAARDKREQPGIDDKILTEWNGLMIVALVEAARALDEPRYQKAAEDTGFFMLANMRADGDQLARTWRNGLAEVPGFSSDYAQFIAGLIALHRSSGRPRTKWLLHAQRLADEAGTLFFDTEYGAYFDTREAQPDLIVRAKAMRDRVLPCANSTMILNLLDLYEITGEASYLDDAAATLDGISNRLRANPATLPLGAVALKRFVDEHPERLRGTPSTSAPPAAVPPQPDPVRVAASVDTLAVSAGRPGRFEVTLEIDDGYHVNAREPGSERLTGLEIRLIGRGLELAAEYPEGEAFRTAGFDEPIRVYSGTVTIPVTVTETAPREAAPRIVVTYQVCTDQVCLKPRRALLTLRVK